MGDVAHLCGQGALSLTISEFELKTVGKAPALSQSV